LFLGLHTYLIIVTFVDIIIYKGTEIKMKPLSFILKSIV